MITLPQETAINSATTVLAEDSPAQLVRQYPPEVDHALGRLGIGSSTKFGYIKGLGTSIVFGTPATWVDLWTYGGLRTSPTGTFTPYAASSSTSDTAVDVTFTYLDAAGAEQTVEITLNGRTPVSLGVTAQEVYRGVNSGTTEAAGQITVATTNSFASGVPTNQDEVLVAIPDHDGQTQVLAGRIMAGKKAIINNINLYGTRDNGSNSSVQLVFQIREAGKTWITKRAYSLSTGAPINARNLGITLPPLCDYRVRVRDVSDEGTDISGSVVYTLVAA